MEAPSKFSLFESSMVSSPILSVEGLDITLVTVCLDPMKKAFVLVHLLSNHCHYTKFQNS